LAAALEGAVVVNERDTAERAPIEARGYKKKEQ